METGDRAGALAKACQEAFQLYPHDCSHAVWHVIVSYKHDQPYMQANQLVAHLSSNTEWKEVWLSELSKLANEGCLVIGGLEGNPHGHVIVVYPGPEKPKGVHIYSENSLSGCNKSW